ncbi:hypothetical protein [Nonomuraea wenchangensis]|uniref:hypothetical protein n=1 Tax=Nonomuraea wenchangensis TaxID=568860 RepID=UPI00331E9745
MKPPPDVRDRLLALASEGVTKEDAAAALGLEVRAVWRYLMWLRDAGAVHLEAAEDGPGIEWWANENQRNA